MKKIYLASSIIFVCSVSSVRAQVPSLNENFDIFPSSWTVINQSDPVGAFAWYKPVSADEFTAHSGDAVSMAVADFQSIEDNNSGTISTWLITPELNLANDATLTFWTRTATASPYPDRLEVRLSTNGPSLNVGTSAVTVGDFTTLLTSINQDLVIGGYPETWTQYTITLSGITTGQTGRVAFRYFVTDGGSNGYSSYYIGLDDVSFTPGTLSANFLNFDGAVKDSRVLLNWSTSSELNNKGFDVERSTNAQDFTAIGFVQGNGTTAIKSNYNFTDGNKFLSGNIYYRLKQIDLDDKYKYSKIIQVNIQNTFKWGIYPNPVVTDSWLQLQLAEKSKVSIQLVTANGSILQSVDKGLLQPGTYSVPLNLNNAAKGTYFARLIVNGKTYSQTIIK